VPSSRPLCAGLAASSCGQAAYAATVDKRTIERSSFERELKALADNRELQAAAGGNSLAGTGKKTVDARLAAGWLTAVIYDALITSEFDRRHLKIRPEDTDAASSQLETQFGNPKVANAFPDWFRKRLVERNSRATAVRAAISGLDLSEDGLHKYYDSHQGDFTQACLSHILVKTKDEADAIDAQIKAASNVDDKFAELAKAKSIDTGSGAKGGDLGCNPKGIFVPEFDKAAFSLPLNTVSDPVQTQFGFHVLLVKKRETLGFEAARSQVKSALNSATQDSFRTWLTTAAGKAKVKVDPRYGKFGTSQPGAAPEVIPPQPPSPPDSRPPASGPTSTVPGPAPETPTSGG
jgi:PPIC-type PPIASE domain